MLCLFFLVVSSSSFLGRLCGLVTFIYESFVKERDTYATKPTSECHSVISHYHIYTRGLSLTDLNLGPKRQIVF